MKKSILIFSAIIITLSLTAFSLINSNTDNSNTIEIVKAENTVVNSYDVKPVQNKTFDDFIYDVGTRFAPIKKSTLQKATSVNAFFEKDRMKSIVKIKSVNIKIIENDKPTEISDIGYSSTLTNEQVKLLKGFNYSTNFSVGMAYTKKIEGIGVLVDNYHSPYLTVVPHKQATYSLGKDALKKHLRDNSLNARAEANVEAEKLKPAKLYFTVTKDGTIENVNLDRSSNYPLVDKTMIELIKNTGKNWIPAENEKGEKVAQELVVSFGLIGC